MATIPPVKYFQRGDRLYVQAQQIWLILVSKIMSSSRNPNLPFKITYGEVAEAMGYPNRQAGHTIGRQLGIVGVYCKMNNLPPLNTIVVNQATGEPGDEVVVRNGKTVVQEQRAVMKQDWYAVRVPTTGTFRKVWVSLGEDDDGEAEAE